jgi:hypothetical protein
MNNVLRVFGVIGLLIILASLAFGLRWAGIQWTGFFGPKEENVRRQIFEETQSFNEGKQQDLAKYYLEYQKGDEQTKAAIKAVVQAQFSYVKKENIESIQMRQFLVQMRGF